MRLRAEAKYAIAVSVMAVAMLGFFMAQSGPTNPVSAAPPEKVHVDLTEWKVDPAVVSGGLGVTNFVFDAQNHGGIPHELLILKTDLDPANLPVKRARVDVASAGELVGHVDNLMPGTSVSVALNLKPGRYVFVCSIAGHYKQGMYAPFQVE